MADRRNASRIPLPVSGKRERGPPTTLKKIASLRPKTYAEMYAAKLSAKPVKATVEKSYSRGDYVPTPTSETFRPMHSLSSLPSTSTHKPTGEGEPDKMIEFLYHNDAFQPILENLEDNSTTKSEHEIPTAEIIPEVEITPIPSTPHAQNEETNVVELETIEYFPLFPQNDEDEETTEEEEAFENFNENHESNHLMEFANFASQDFTDNAMRKSEELFTGNQTVVEKVQDAEESPWICPDLLKRSELSLKKEQTEEDLWDKNGSLGGATVVCLVEDGLTYSGRIEIENKSGCYMGYKIFSNSKAKGIYEVSPSVSMIRPFNTKQIAVKVLEPNYTPKLARGDRLIVYGINLCKPLYRKDDLAEYLNAMCSKFPEVGERIVIRPLLMDKTDYSKSSRVELSKSINQFVQEMNVIKLNVRSIRKDIAERNSHMGILMFLTFVFVVATMMFPILNDGHQNRFAKPNGHGKHFFTEHYELAQASFSNLFGLIP